ncbi:hypothetical protein HZH68_015422 [Vespula germanica]|uniref:Cytochrome P450 n=1 Tax=Vespula germanica TaxID=30212 RepID=A0A834MTM7_VESGE|nr:hypothetical protein HZH68_015422 [Vespula germanica]
MVLTIILISLFIFIFLQILSKFYKIYVYRKTINRIPGTVGFPFIGILINLMKLTQYEYYESYCKDSFRYKKGIYKLWLGNQALVYIYKPEYVQILLKNSTNINKSFFYNNFKPWLGNGLITSRGSKWFHDRKLITPAFHFSALDNFITVMVKKAEILINRIEKELDKNLGKNAININPLISDFTLDVICETAMGVNIHVQENATTGYSKHIRRVTRAVMYRIIRPWLNFDCVFALTTQGKKYFSSIKEIHRFDREVIKKKKEARRLKCEEVSEIDEFGRKKKKAFLDILLDINENNSNPLSDEDIREQVDTIMFAGHDTSSSAIIWTLLCLATEPEIQDKVYEELKNVFDEFDSTISIKTIFQLKYLEKVCKETLRLFPVIPTYSRQITEEIMIDKYVIPKNTILSIHVYGLHHDPEIWTNPEKFDPDRFSTDETQHRNPYSFLPFSAGPRNCIGQKYASLEQKLVIAMLLRKWIVKSSIQRKDVKIYHSIVLQPLHDLHLYFVPRK